MFGKSASSITDYLADSDSFDPNHCVSLLHRSLKKKADAVVESIEGYQMLPEQKFRVRIIRNHLDFVEKSIHELDEMINILASPYESAIQLLCVPSPELTGLLQSRSSPR